MRKELSIIRVPKFRYYAIYNGTAYEITRGGYRRMTRDRKFPHSTRQH